MAETFRIPTTARTEFGKGAARRARRAGQIPAVLYGHGTDPVHLNLPELEFAAVMRTHGTNAILNLDIDGKDQLALAKAVTVHPIKNYIEHTDLLIVKRGEKVTVDVPVSVVGEAGPGTLVTQELTVLSVEADALSIPEEFEVSVADAEAGTQITAADVPLPAGTTLIDDPELLLVNVVEAPTADELEPEAEEAAEAVEEAGEAAAEAPAEES